MYLPQPCLQVSSRPRKRAGRLRLQGSGILSNPSFGGRVRPQGDVGRDRAHYKMATAKLLNLEVFISTNVVPDPPCWRRMARIVADYDFGRSSAKWEGREGKRWKDRGGAGAVRLPRKEGRAAVRGEERTLDERAHKFRHQGHPWAALIRSGFTRGGILNRSVGRPASCTFEGVRASLTHPWEPPRPSLKVNLASLFPTHSTAASPPSLPPSHPIASNLQESERDPFHTHSL